MMSYEIASSSRSKSGLLAMTMFFYVIAWNRAQRDNEAISNMYID
jgi:cbb3-type cytochrome oxidase subunit 3